MVEFLPSKQAVAGSSPVSRSTLETVSLLAHYRPLRGKQAARGSASRRFYVVQKGVQRHPASIWGAHYFTRNRTRGSDFPPFFYAHRKSQPSFPVAFVCFFGSRKGWLFVVGWVRFLVKPTFFGGWWSVCVTGRTTSASDLLGRI